MTARPPALLEQFYADLGPMTGPPEYIRERSESLVRTFAALLNCPDIRLVDSPEGGKTDCSSTIWAPLQTPEGYLVVEHELSHWLFETDVVLADKYVEMIVSRLLRKAGITAKTDEAMPYERHLKGIVHHLWNVLEDWRCCWLWTCLYYGGGTLLQRRWRDICAYDIQPAAVRQNLVVCLQAYAGGVEVTDTSAEFDDCKKAMRKALNLVEGVDAVACLAITSKLIAEIAQILLDNNPPPPPQPPAGGGGSSPGTGNKGRGPVQEKKEREEQARRDALHTLKLLCGMMPRTGPQAKAGQSTGGLGEYDLAPPAKPASGGGGKLSDIQRLQGAEDRESDASGMTPFQLILHQGAEGMEARLEEARAAMVRNQDTTDQENAQIHLGWSKECGIPVRHVEPSRELPPPTHVAHENRRILEQLRMRKRRKVDYDGVLHTERLLSAVGDGELDRPFYENVVKTPRFELLFVIDLSGSMTIGQALELTDRALADSVHAVLAIRSKAWVWGFSSELFMYDRLGSIQQTRGVVHGMTCTVQALDVAHRWGKRDPTKRAIMLVTDGEPTSCRARNSTGNPLDDLHAVLGEIRGDRIPLAVLGIRHAMWTMDATSAMYDRAFGAGTYGMVDTFDDLAVELPRAVRVMAEAHITRGARRA